MKWRLFIRDCYCSVKDVYFYGEYYDLMALIGLLHSKSELYIKRIDYQSVDVVPIGKKVIFIIGSGEKYYYKYRIEGKI